MIRPTLNEFRELAKQGNLVPVCMEVLADLETPVSVFRKLKSSPHSFLLESVEQGEQLGRYSFLGAEPLLVFQAAGGEQTLTFRDRELPVEKKESPQDTLRGVLAHFQPVTIPDLPPLTGGAVGYMSYDTVRYYEEIPDRNPDTINTPDCLFMLADSIVAFDHVKHRMLLIANALVEEGASLEEIYADAVKRVKALRDRVTAAPVAPEKREPVTGSIDVSSNCTREEFEDWVRICKDYIHAGDIFQVVISQRFTTDLKSDPFDIYRAVRAVNPSPYMFYLSCGDFQIAGSSPEILVRCQDGQVTVRPIAGTRKRGGTPAEDVALEKDLLADEKEIAEHVMLVDLGRNDVGRVSEYGSVRVTDFEIIERYSHVMHIVSNVVGDLAEGKDAFDALGACFPAGTLSGAPKIRAMQIIDELENLRRGIYGGAVCYFGFNGSMDSAITIRTAIIKDGKVNVQAGAGIVADSVPATEYEETVNKAKAMIRAIEWANAGLE